MSDITWHNERRRLGDLTPQPDNPRQIHKVQAARLVTSLEDFDQVETIAVSPDGEVYNGHQRLAVWQQKYGPDYEVDVRVASRALTHKEWQRLTVLLHRGTTGEWDFDGLANWEGVDVADLLDWGFDAEELGWAGEDPPAAPEAQTDRAAELQVQWGTERGQVWEVSRHRVMCGDSTSAEDVAMLMGGEKAQMLLNDPPYGIGLQTDNSNRFAAPAFARAKGLKGGNKFSPIVGDDVDYDAAPVMAMFQDVQEQFWFGADYYSNTIDDTMHGGAWLVWDKRVDEQADKMLGSSFELLWSRQKHRREILRHKWVYIFGTEHEPQRGRQHPTQKPVALYNDLVARYSESGEIVVDCYLGSGTTLVACEQLGRIGYGMEISPAYVAVTLQRLADMGLEPRLAE